MYPESRMLSGYCFLSSHCCGTCEDFDGGHSILLRQLECIVNNNWVSASAGILFRFLVHLDPADKYPQQFGCQLGHVAEQKITSGAIFMTRSGRPMSRTNIWREMKGLCEQAGVNPQKVFPHNLRHLFARVFYGIEKDIAKLADILGHSSINTTRIYIISTGDEHRRRMENMRLIL